MEDERQKRKKSKPGVWRKPGSQRWWLSYIDPETGKQGFISTGTTDKELAEKRRTAFLEELDGIKRKKGQSEYFTFDEMMDRFMTEHAPTQEPTTQKRYPQLLAHLRDFFGGMTLDIITTDTILEYVFRRRRERKIVHGKPVSTCSAATRNRELAMLSKAFNLARLWGWATQNPCSLVPREDEKNKNIGRAMTTAEEEILLPICQNYLHGQLREMVIIAVNTGIRQGELLKLTWENIDLFRRAFKSYNDKVNEWHVVAMNETVYELLKEKAKAADIMVGYVFKTENGTPVEPRSVLRAWHNAQTKASIQPHLRWHDLRHTFGTRMAESGVDIHTIAKALDHSQLSTTQRYAKHSLESLRRAVNKLDEYSRRRTE